jgi:hypothetical protein
VLGKELPGRLHIHRMVRRLKYVRLGQRRMKVNIHIDHRISIDPGSPSVLFRRQLCHICGIIWTHQQTAVVLVNVDCVAWIGPLPVPMVPSTVEASGMLTCGLSIV